MSKIVSKKLLDKAIELTRSYFDQEAPFDKGLLNQRTNACKKLEDAAGVGCITFSDLLSSIFTYSGLKTDATNEDVYKVLEVLGWSVE